MVFRQTYHLYNQVCSVWTLQHSFISFLFSICIYQMAIIKYLVYSIID